jgi:hypothetical protein
MSIGFTTDQGAQIQSFTYQESAEAKIFNRLLATLLPAGIYSGFSLTRLDATHVQVAAGTCFIKDGNNTTDSGGNPLNVMVRVEFTASQTINLDDGVDPGYCDPANPYLVLRFGWNDQVNNYANVIAVAFSNNPSETNLGKILPTDIILGKIIFDVASGHSTISLSTSVPFDLTRQSVAFLPDGQAAFVELRVSTSEINSQKVYVNAGSINTSIGRMLVAGGDYPSASIIPNTVAGRYDLIWVDVSGAIQVMQGIDAASPVAPPYGTMKVIAEIHRGASRTDIKGPDIFPVDVTRQGQVSAADIGIVDSGAYFTPFTYPSGYTVKTVEAALQQLAAAAASVLSGFNTHIALDIGAGQTAHGITIANSIT